MVSSAENDGSYNWKVPGTRLNGCLIRISDLNSNASDKSNLVFSIICELPDGHLNFCRDCGPCDAEQGDCDSDGECRGDLVCAQVVGEVDVFECQSSP
jgi:hypothetical protein